MAKLVALTLVGIILIAAGIVGMYIDVTRRLMKIKRSMQIQRQELNSQDRRITVIENRDRDHSNHVYFCTDNEIDEVRPDYSDIKYGGEGI